MDIAKIRKKAKEKEKEQRAAESHDEAAENRAAGSAGKAAGAVPEAAGEIVGEAEGPGGEELEEVKGPPVSNTAMVPAEEPGELQDTAESQAEGSGNVLELLSFSVEGKEFAFRVADVEEIIPYHNITSVPLLPGYVSGIMSLRGKIIPVIDLRSRFGLREGRHEPSSSADPAAKGKEKILILSGPRGLIGASVDRIKGVVRCPEESVLAPPAHLTEEERRFIEGVIIQEKRFISVVRFGDAMNIEVG